LARSHYQSRPVDDDTLFRNFRHDTRRSVIAQLVFAALTWKRYVNVINLGPVVT
jgi:hypothetical protein